MIAQEFLDELAETRESFDWKLLADPRRVIERRKRPRLRIRAESESEPNATFEPIGAVCYFRTGRVFGVDSWLDAAEAIELSLIDAADLMAAGNDRLWKSEGGVRRPDDYLHSLREKLQEALRLESSGHP